MATSANRKLQHFNQQDCLAEEQLTIWATHECRKKHNSELTYNKR